ncbi:MAG: hypothetical protein M1820_010162 [Bogoriella megaspora]|nr:MAG: hypothetical protein M1820_010162 [Bogoriella megaspora]
MVREEVIRQTPAPLPPLPKDDPLTSDQWQTLLALADAMISSIKPASTAKALTDQILPDTQYSETVNVIRSSISEKVDDDLLKQYLVECPSSISAFKSNVHRLMAEYIPVDSRTQMLYVLSALNTRPGALLLTGSATPFSIQSLSARQAILRSWSNSYLPPLRMLSRSLGSLMKLYWARTSPTLGRILSYPRTPVHGIPGEGFDFAFLQFPQSASPETIETDVVIVGSGCGASVCAKNLSDAGLKIVVVDKAYHWPPQHLPMSEENAAVHMFMNGGAIVSDDTATSIIAGSAWGGGGTINWSASLQTQGFVRQEWAEAPNNLPFFTSAAFQDSLDRVCERMGVTAQGIRHNKTNRVLLEGARKLGWAHKEVPQNCGFQNDRHYCGYCTLGCGSCGKKGPTETFLPDAAKAGAKFIEGFDAREVLFETRGSNKTAVGVRGIWTSRDSAGGVSGSDQTTREVVIKAKRVIVSGGTMQSPLLLLRSGLRNPNIGRNLHIHPVSVIVGIFDEEVRPWEGGILTAVCNEFENLDGRGHGSKIEAMTMLPAWVLPFLPWTGDGLDYKTLAAKFKNMCGFISLARDRDSGQVYPDAQTGKPRVTYTPSKFDQKHILEGIIGIAKMLYVEGAREILTVAPGFPSFIRTDSEIESSSGINDPRFQAWLSDLRAFGFPSPQSIFGSAHQMGTCKMGSSPRTSVVDSKGKVWEAEGCYVADASVFPSASGVNPMVTNMAIADYISKELANDLNKTGTPVVDRARLAFINKIRLRPPNWPSVNQNSENGFATTTTLRSFWISGKKSRAPLLVKKRTEGADARLFSLDDQQTRADSTMLQRIIDAFRLGNRSSKDPTVSATPHAEFETQESSESDTIETRHKEETTIVGTTAPLRSALATSVDIIKAEFQGSNQREMPHPGAYEQQDVAKQDFDQLRGQGRQFEGATLGSEHGHPEAVLEVSKMQAMRTNYDKSEDAQEMVMDSGAIRNTSRIIETTVPEGASSSFYVSSEYWDPIKNTIITSTKDDAASHSVPTDQPLIPHMTGPWHHNSALANVSCGRIQPAEEHRQLSVSTISQDKKVQHEEDKESWYSCQSGTNQAFTRISVQPTGLTNRSYSSLRTGSDFGASESLSLFNSNTGVWRYAEHEYLFPKLPEWAHRLCYPSKEVLDSDLP